MYYQEVTTTLPIVWLILPVAATLMGGLFALRLGRFRPLLVAAGAGLLLGAAFLDLLPEAIMLGLAAGWKAAGVLGWTLVFFLLFSALEMALEAGSRRWTHSLQGRGAISKVAGRTAAAFLIFHSFRDGMAIGAAFAASPAAGYAVATGIAAHDFGDGMNTIILSTQGAPATRTDYLLLALDALAPFVGGLLTVWLLLASGYTVLLLTVAAGFFLQMATSEFLPQIKQHPGPRGWWMLAVVAAGVAMIEAANLLVQ